ncbi:FERM and PDZ domain-containing protein 2 [Fukomys damarensis]|uniref:FERM and PDZ domain-containing protein 2 n=1 Tax=Fukomys damarensis TaxID=885580 RepID=A0A091DU11_FUKDA|nr:FERM and PDZ domain-containing protein 2 [Fukomys damarensis]
MLKQRLEYGRDDNENCDSRPAVLAPGDSRWSLGRRWFQCTVTEAVEVEGTSSASVTLASALQVRGKSLSEEEIWSLLSLAVERLLEDLSNEAAPFKAPELLQGQSKDERPDASQPLQLCQPLHALLLAMCEDQPCRRCPLHTIMEACQAHQEEVAAHSALASLHVRRLVGLVLGTISEVEEDDCTQQSRSYLLRKRLQSQSGESPKARALDCVQPCRGNEFFFLDRETRLCKIASEDWREQPLKTSTDTFTLFLRIKFFVSHCGLLQHSSTQHQFYLQLRKDVLEERLHCDDGTLLQLGVLALQAEFGSYPKEQAEKKPYFRVEDYIPATLITRMTTLRVQVEVSEMHRLSTALWGKGAELEFLRVTQQLLEYGILVHRVFPKKKRLEGEMALGVCAEGVIVYEVKNHSRIATLWFPWREIGKISTYPKKFSVTSSITGKKHTFATDSAKTCTYLLGLCSAQHGFHAQTGSGQPPCLLTEKGKLVQSASLSPVQQAQSKPLTWIERLSGSEKKLFAPRVQDATGSLLGESLENFSMNGTKETRVEGIGGSPYTGQEQQDSACSIQKPMTWDLLLQPPVQSMYLDKYLFRACAQDNRREPFTAQPGQELVHVVLKRDTHCGFGGQILALNHISLEGFTFNMAVRMIQNSLDHIELTISQAEGICRNAPRKEKDSTASCGTFSKDILSGRHQGRLSSHPQDQDRDPEEREMAQAESPMFWQSPQGSPLPVKGGINTSVLHGGIYVKSIIPGGPAAKEGQILQGPRFEVRLQKNTNGLGFSFVQVEQGSCSLLQSDLIRIKRLFPGQPAQEHGAIEAGDIILAVNGRPTEGLVFQTPMDKEFTKAMYTDSEKSPSLEQEDSWRDSTSPDAREGLALGEAQGSQDGDRPWARSLALALESHPHLWHCHLETEEPALATPLEQDMRQNCYSVCDIRRLGR